jgi:hypothetical protein
MAKKLALVSETATATATADNDDKIPLTAFVDKALLAEIDEYRWSNRIEGRAATLRQLIIRGLHPVKA